MRPPSAVQVSRKHEKTQLWKIPTPQWRVKLKNSKSKVTSFLKFVHKKNTTWWNSTIAILSDLYGIELILSKVWKYFGHVKEKTGLLIDAQHYYCEPCLILKKVKRWVKWKPNSNMILMWFKKGWATVVIMYQFT